MHSTKSEPNLNYGFWVIMMCHNIFIHCSKYTTPVKEVDNGGGYSCVEAEDIWEISVPSSKFYCKSKIDLKIMLQKTFFF